MKIKTKAASYDYVMTLKKPAHKRPKRPSILFRTLIRLLSIPELMSTKFEFTKERMDEAGEGPYLILMNHSAFIDLKIAFKIFYPMPFCTVCTSDGFVGKRWLMRQIGCIPTNKFVTDLTLITDMLHTLNKLNTSILMYPEASYSFDGCATPLPRGLGKLLKRMNVPVLTVMTEGAFLHDPLYNCLKKRKTKVTARLTCLLTREEIKNKSVEEIDSILDAAFSFDNFARQYETGTEIKEPFRAEGLERILYKCAACHSEGTMRGEGTHITCGHCGKIYEFDTLGRLKALSGETEFEHIPDWYRWERECVANELINGEYLLDTAVDIGIMTDYKKIYMVGEGRLIHNADGFTLTGCDGKLSYSHPPLSSYGLYADYYWYEIGDVICIGNKERLYYCFPKSKSIVAKARLAAEELYRLKKQETVKK